MYDLAIIGGGPAGYSAAFEAAKLQMRVVLFERDHLGGTCLNRGCVPTKYLSHVGKKLWDAERPDPDGITYTGAVVDYFKTVGRMDGIVADLRGQLEGLLAYGQVQVIRGDASINGKKQIMCDGDVFEARNILIATGSKPARPFIEGAITSDELLKMTEIPKKLHVLGGGVVAVEFAHIFRMLGSEVTMSIRGERLLRKWDEDIAGVLTRSMERDGIRIQKKCDFNNLSVDKDSIVLSALGREAVLPFVEGKLFETGKNGGIIADKNGRTAVPGVYAAGDVLEDSTQLAHIGMEQGKRAVRHMAGLPLEDMGAVIQCIYGDQEAVSIGLTEKEANEKGLDIVTIKMNMSSNARSLISDHKDGFTKILAEKGTGYIVGAQLVSDRAGDMAAELALAMHRKLTVTELLGTVRPHPSFCESISDVLHVLESQPGIRPEKKEAQKQEPERKGGLRKFWK